ncbi:hypothetical protein FRC12_023626 [Ceratobasidium sp. 428]|nr:hypothetical protein FRC12_023626 [Ceratobasidium sp. 428]
MGATILILPKGKIFVTTEGRMKIGEFGLAASTARFSHLVPSISFSGLVRWMSPERLQLEAAGRDEPASTQSDIWSLGCTIAEIVTEQLPYAKYKHDAKITQRIMKGELPTAIEQIILHQSETEGTSDGGVRTKSPCTTFLQEIVHQCWAGVQYRVAAENLLDQHKSRSHGLSPPPSQGLPAPHTSSGLSVDREHDRGKLASEAGNLFAKLEAQPSSPWKPLLHSNTAAQSVDVGSLYSTGRPIRPCGHCRSRRVRCDGAKPFCTRCVHQGTVDKCRYSEEVPARSKSSLEKGKNVELEWQSMAPRGGVGDMADSDLVTGKAPPNEFISVTDHDWLDDFDVDPSSQAPQLYPESPVFSHPGPGEWSDTLPSIFYEGAL